MGFEIERKFIITNLLPLCDASHHNRIRQGYLNLNIYRTVRVRMLDDTSWLTIKGINDGAVRKEFEYEIPHEEGLELLKMCDGGFIDKVRYYIPHGDLTIEFDVFNEDNAGLYVAEIEFNEDDPRADLSEGEIQHHLPDWLGEEVTNDARYYNSSLITTPFNTWSK